MARTSASRPTFLMLPLLLLSPLALAQDCAEVAAATVEELRAGEAAPLTAEQLSLARRAAGAACVKARSGRFAAIQSSAVAARDQDGGDGSSGQQGEAAGGKEDTEEDGGVDLWPFDDLKFNDVSASPSKKPYERRRLDRDDD